MKFDELFDFKSLVNDKVSIWFYARVVLFLVLNFAILAIGSKLMGPEGANPEFYKMGDRAPWTPPGWVFGAAWFIIMFCFAFYMAKLWEIEGDPKASELKGFWKRQINGNRDFVITFFIVQAILNIAWNPVFFQYAQVGPALGIIALLTFLILYVMFKYIKKMKYYSFLILPYSIWLCIATSLNYYFWMNNPPA